MFGPIWDRWDALEPLAQVRAGVEADESFVAATEQLSEPAAEPVPALDVRHRARPRRAARAAAGRARRPLVGARARPAAARAARRGGARCRTSRAGTGSAAGSESCSVAATNDSSASTPARTWASGSSASQRSQISPNTSPPGAGSSVTPARRYSSKISAWLPRWDATSATVHSWAFDGRVASTSVRVDSRCASRSCERRTAASQTAAPRSGPGEVAHRPVTPSSASRSRSACPLWRAYSAIRWT